MVAQMLALKCELCGCKLRVNLLPVAPEPKENDPQIQHCQTPTAPSTQIKGPVIQFCEGATSSHSQHQLCKTGHWLAPQISVRISRNCLCLLPGSSYSPRAPGGKDQAFTNRKVMVRGTAARGGTAAGTATGFPRGCPGRGFSCCPGKIG